jgi:hypothetical protein
MSHTEAGKRLEMLMEDGILAIANVHTNIRATRYKYVGKRGIDCDGSGHSPGPAVPDDARVMIVSHDTGGPQMVNGSTADSHGGTAG